MIALVMKLFFVCFLQPAAAVLPEPPGTWTNATLRREAVSASVTWRDGIAVIVKSASSTSNQVSAVRGIKDRLGGFVEQI